MRRALFLDEFLPCSTNPTAQLQPFLFINDRPTEITPEMAEERPYFRGPGTYYDPDAVPVPIPPKYPPKYFLPRSDPSIPPPQSSSSAISGSSTLLSAPAGNGISYWSERRSAATQAQPGLKRRFQMVETPSNQPKKLQATKAPSNWREASQAIQDLTGPMRKWRYNLENI